MRKFVAKHAAVTTGTLSCFDRVLFKGHLPLGYPHAMEEFLQRQGVLFKQLKGFVLQQAERLRTHSHAVAERAGRPWQYFESPVRKDERARAIATRDGITEGLICVFATVEPCRSFRLAYGRGRPAIRPAWRKCLLCPMSSRGASPATGPRASMLGTTSPRRRRSEPHSRPWTAWSRRGGAPEMRAR
jgi:hypothetical protein